jgi:arginine decarboxylase-like protein
MMCHQLALFGFRLGSALPLVLEQLQELSTVMVIKSNIYLIYLPCTL